MSSGHLVTLLTAADYHLCEHARHVLQVLSVETPLTIREIAWDGEEGSSLVTRDGAAFPPAVYVNGTLAGYGRLSERALRRRFAELEV